LGVIGLWVRQVSLQARTGEAAVVNSHGRFVWYELITTDMQAATAFYTKVMGWGAWDASVPGRRYVLFSAGAASVGGLMGLPEDARKTGVKPSWIGYVGVDDVDATADRIKRLGGTMHVPPTDVAGTSRFAIFADPQTARLALFKWLKPGQQQPAKPGALGHVGWHELLAADREKALAFYGELFGWQKADADVGATGTYQLFSVAGQTIGGMLTKPPITPDPFWLHYFNVGDIGAATKRVKAGGGQVVHGPVEGRDGRWIAQCMDPQGALFALQGKRRPDPIGYFAPAASRRAD
jgi:predicted enzyme related to lactoylglutathione lyase